jgi:dihydroorotate dehydrogenase
MILSGLSPLLRVPLLAGLTRDSLLKMDPETAHGATITALRLGLAPQQDGPDAPELKTTIAGLELSNPVGMAAGFDKNGEVPRPLALMGFGMVEIGTVTPRPQSGNPKPRLFRVGTAEGVINRMGFNNEGHDEVYRRLKGVRVPAALGVNIGANKNTSDFTTDYAKGVARFARIADYLTVNISSPNTPGLRELQRKSTVTMLVERLLAARAAVAPDYPPLLLLKIAPDLTPEDRADLAEAAVTSGLDGLVVSNTTVARPATLKSRQAPEPGGLSGRPLFEPSTALLAEMYQLTGGKLPLIGVGGVSSGADAYAKIRAGASLVQLYTALVYQGPGLVERIKRELAALLARDGFADVAAAVGSASPCPAASDHDL